MKYKSPLAFLPSCFLALFSLLALLPYSSSAQPLKLASIFGDNMLLQQNEAVSIWGWAERTAEITIIAS